MTTRHLAIVRHFRLVVKLSDEHRNVRELTIAEQVDDGEGRKKDMVVN